MTATPANTTGNDRAQSPKYVTAAISNSNYHSLSLERHLSISKYIRDFDRMAERPNMRVP
jgi:hypothetical protein